MHTAYPSYGKPHTFNMTRNQVNATIIIWDNFVEKALYGKTLEVTYPRDGPLDEIKIDTIEQEPDLLKMHPSIWSKIYRRDLIMDNDIRFQPFISGDDLAFYVEALIHAKGIIFLNSFMCYDYYIRDLPTTSQSPTTSTSAA